MEENEGRQSHISHQKAAEKSEYKATRMVMIRHAPMGTPSTKSFPPIRAAQNITGPMEKSISPVAITKVTPRARKPRKYA